MASKRGALEAGAYRREDVRRIAGITERQLRSWEKQGLITPSESFHFSDLLAIQTLRKLRELRIPPAEIRRAIASLRKGLLDIDQPLSQLRITAEGRKIAVHIGEGRLEPVTGQWLLDFGAKEIEKLRAFPRSEKSLAEQEAENLRLSEHWFARGLTLEETGASGDEAVRAYQKAVEYNPKASGALVNLGTISFRMHRLREALALYLRAMEADPTYPLAHFNLGNLYDEQGQTEEARKHYLEAIRLNPRYADAHFNMALLCERNNELLQATAYWQAYLKLDPVSAWASTARKQLDRLKRTLRSK
jgi:tetratricopeptide (TPR) repeat protein